MKDVIPCESIDEIRANIDRIDAGIVSLIAERGGYVKQAACFKKTTDEVKAPQRVEHVINKVRDLARELGADAAVTEQVYRTMIAAFIDAELVEHASRQINSSSEPIVINLTDSQSIDAESGSASLTFLQLTDGWNADLNAPNPTTQVDGRDLLLKFDLDAMQFPDFELNEFAILRFENCERYRLGATNDEGWYRGKCRFSSLAPAWGEFYLIRGADPLLALPADWQAVGTPSGQGQHFLFYFRENTFECVADQVVIEPNADNGLVRTGKKLRVPSSVRK
ncbi:MAG: hypothetical protein EXR86_12970 [Gammaproteobacteria bacterium]|nr:hypothetical protein [Gammaproteobacteria bacterium]